MLVYATGGTEAPPEVPVSPAGGLAGNLLFFAVMIAAFYLILILPQRKKDKKQKEMIMALTVGDKITSIGGIHGKIIEVKDDTIVIDSGAGNDKAKIRLSKWAVKECHTIHDS